MKNTIGQNVAVTLFGESHGPYIGAVLDGIAPGIRVDEAFIAARLARRRPSGLISTQRREADDFRIVSGFRAGYTTGTPLCILIPNADTRSADYAKTEALARPGHADYTAYCKYHGFEDRRGGGHFSGRTTAALVAAGAVCEQALAMQGISVGTHILCAAGIDDRRFGDEPTAEIAALAEKSFPVLSDEAGEQMRAAIEEARQDCDSVGGVLETAVAGFPAGVGEPYFDSLESLLSHAVLSVPAVKGIQFGEGFGFARMRGSEANDPFAIREGKIVTLTNRNGGINGGISNGMPIVFSCAVKPTPSIAREQDTVNFEQCTEAKIAICGRHDPAIIHRACPVISAVTAIVLCDALATRYGTDFPHRDIQNHK